MQFLITRNSGKRMMWTAQYLTLFVILCAALACSVGVPIKGVLERKVSSCIGAVHATSVSYVIQWELAGACQSV